MATQLLKISDRIKVGGKLGTVIAVEPRSRATIYTIAFTKDLPRKFICPSTVIEKVFSLIELLKSDDFDKSFWQSLNGETGNVVPIFGFA